MFIFKQVSLVEIVFSFLHRNFCLIDLKSFLNKIFGDKLSSKINVDFQIRPQKKVFEILTNKFIFFLFGELYNTQKKFQIISTKMTI